MNYKNISIGFGILIIIVTVIVLIVKSRKSQTKNLQCGQYEKLIDGECVSVCGIKMIRNSAPWYCKEEDLYCDGTSWTCSSFCSAPSIRNNISCPNGTSIGCDSTGYFCQNSCNNNGTQYLKYQDLLKSPDTVCSCNTGFYGPNCQYSSQITCNNNGIPDNNGKCNCNQGYNGPNCSIYCPTTSSYFNGTGCSCKNGYTLQDGVCQPNTNCGGKGVLSNGVCDCNEGYIRDPDNPKNCIPCLNGSKSNSDNTFCILPNPLKTSNTLDGCDMTSVIPNKYVEYQYVYGIQGENTSLCYFDNQHTASNADISPNGTCICEPGTDGQYCQNNSYNKCNDCKGLYTGNDTCSCYSYVDTTTPPISGCNDNDIWVKNVYNAGQYCQTQYSCYGPAGLSATGALNGDFSCNCGGCACQGTNVNGNVGCSKTIATYCSSTGTITCNTDGSTTCNCPAGIEGTNCQCNQSSLYSPINALELTDICGNGLNDIQIYQCMQNPTGNNSIGNYSKVKPATCLDYNKYISNLYNYSIITSTGTSSRLCSSFCSSNEIGPICNDTINGPEFQCIPNCQTQEPLSCPMGTTYECDVTTNYVGTCVTTTNIYNNFPANNLYVPPDFDKYCPGALPDYYQNLSGQPGVFNFLACGTNNGNPAYVANCEIPGYFTIPKTCIENQSSVTELTTDTGTKDRIYEYNTTPLFPTYRQFYNNVGNGPIVQSSSCGSNCTSVTTSNLEGTIYANGAPLYWMFKNPAGHLVDSAFTN